MGMMKVSGLSAIFKKERFKAFRHFFKSESNEFDPPPPEKALMLRSLLVCKALGLNPTKFIECMVECKFAQQVVNISDMVNSKALEMRAALLCNAMLCMCPWCGLLKPFSFQNDWHAAAQCQENMQHRHGTLVAWLRAGDNFPVVTFTKKNIYNNDSNLDTFVTDTIGTAPFQLEIDDSVVKPTIREYMVMTKTIKSVLFNRGYGVIHTVLCKLTHTKEMIKLANSAMYGMLTQEE